MRCLPPSQEYIYADDERIYVMDDGKAFRVKIEIESVKVEGK